MTSFNELFSISLLGKDALYKILFRFMSNNEISGMPGIFLTNPILYRFNIYIYIYKYIDSKNNKRYLMTKDAGTRFLKRRIVCYPL